MDPLAILVVGFFVLCIIRIPIPFALGLSALFVLLYEGISLRQMVLNMMRGIDLFPLLAIPFFILAGQIMNKSDITERLVSFSRALVGHIRGGLAHVNVVVSMFFAGISGSSTADTAGVGSVLIPAMKMAGYPANFSVAITAMSSTMGNIIPPSIYMVIYGAMGGTSIGALFLGGAIPGVMVGLSQMILAYYLARRHNYPAETPMVWRERARAAQRAALAILVPILVIGGIVSGLFSPTEAAAVLVVYCLVISLGPYRSLSWSDIPQILLEAGKAASIPMFTVACAAIFGWIIGYLRGPELVAQHIEGLTTNPASIITLLVFFLLLLGTFLSEIATIIIFLPIIQRLGDLAGMHPIQLGVLVVMVLSLGLVTPPYGICLLISCGIGKVNVLQAFYECLLFVLLFLGIITVVAIFPELTLWLPRILMPTFV